MQLIHVSMQSNETVITLSHSGSGFGRMYRRISDHIRLRQIQCCSYYFYGTHLYLHRGAILLDHRVGTFIGRRCNWSVEPDPRSGADSHVLDARSGSGRLTTRLPSATVRPHLRCVGDTALAVRPRTRAVQHRGANFRSASRQRATISGTSCRRRWPTRSASSAVSKYQPPSRAAHQAVYCFSGCRSSSLERSARGRRLIVIIADFLPSIKMSFSSTFIPSPDFLTAWLAS